MCTKENGQDKLSFFVLESSFRSVVYCSIDLPEASTWNRHGRQTADSQTPYGFECYFADRLLNIRFGTKGSICENEKVN